MLSLPRVLRDYREAGALNELIALWGFVSETAFLTKAGHVGLVYRLRGIDPEGRTHDQREAVTRQMSAALHALDEKFRLYQYLVKRSAPPVVSSRTANPVVDGALRRHEAFFNDSRTRRFELGTYVVLLYEGDLARRRGGANGLRRSPRAVAQDWLAPSATFAVVEREVDRAVATLERAARVFEAHLAELGAERLGNNDAYGFFRVLGNAFPSGDEVARTAPETHLDYFIGDSEVECHRDHLAIGGRTVKVLSMKEPPAQTFAFMLGDLCAVPGEFIACLEWRRLAVDRVRRDIRTRRRHFFNKRVALVNFVAPDVHPDEMLVDDSASAVVAQLGLALTDIEVNGHFFGECALTLVFCGTNGRSVQESVAAVSKVFAANDAVLIDETYNLLNAWLSVLPGNAANNLRRLALLECHAADLSFLFTRDPGDRVCRHLRREALTVFLAASAFRIVVLPVDLLQALNTGHHGRVDGRRRVTELQHGRRRESRAQSPRVVLPLGEWAGNSYFRLRASARTRSTAADAVSPPRERRPAGDHAAAREAWLRGQSVVTCSD